MSLTAVVVQDVKAHRSRDRWVRMLEVFRRGRLRSGAVPVLRRRAHDEGFARLDRLTGAVVEHEVLSDSVPRDAHALALARDRERPPATQAIHATTEHDLSAEER